MGIAGELFTHFLASSLSIGSSLSQTTHFSFGASIGTMRGDHSPSALQTTGYSVHSDLLGAPNLLGEPLFLCSVAHFLGGTFMEEVVDQVMRTYGMMVNLSPEEKQSARERLTEFLKDKNDSTRKLSVEGVKFLRGERLSRTRRAKHRLRGY
jgi:hypothetical protein